jgi:FkbM family methyltransferase
MIPLKQSIVRTATLWNRRRAARRFGLSFGRAASFTLPKTIRLDGRDLPIDVPDEPSQRVAFVELLLDDCYRLRWLAEHARIETIVDIGANVGLFGLAARAAFPTATLHAYEPNPLLAERLAHHARLAGIEYWSAAVGREAGMVSLETKPQASVLSRSIADPAGAIERVAFRETLARIGGHADLVKLDCEGAEWEILEDREAWRCVDYLTMEYHLARGQGHDAIAAALSAIGFAIVEQQPASDFGLILAQRNAGRSAAA